jgi:hypothetical protein
MTGCFYEPVAGHRWSARASMRRSPPPRCCSSPAIARSAPLCLRLQRGSGIRRWAWWPGGQGDGAHAVGERGGRGGNVASPPCPLWACVVWLESVAKSLPPWNPRSNAMSIACPSGWRPTPAALGFASGSPIVFPSWSTRMSGVNGLVWSKSPDPNADWSLHRLCLRLQRGSGVRRRGVEG